MADGSNKVQGKKKKHTGRNVLIIVLVLAALFAVWRFMGGTRPGQTASTESQLNTATASIGSISVIAEGSGYVEPASTKAVTFPYDGKLKELSVETGDQVKSGDVLAKYDADDLDDAVDAKKQELSDLNDQIAAAGSEGSSSITSPVKGRVKRIYASSGDVVSEVVDRNGGLLEISADGKLKVEFQNEKSSIRVGDSVTVEFDSESVTGRIVSAGDGQYTATIPDSTDYQVDTAVTVRGSSGERLGEGKLESNSPYLVRANYGVIDTVEVSKTSQVDVGTTLFTRKDSDYNSTYTDLLSKREDKVQELQDLLDFQKDPVIKADCDGYVATLDAVEGMRYTKDAQLLTIADAQGMDLKVDIDEHEIDGVMVGQKADVSFDAFEDETFEGTVEKISGVGTNTGGVTTYSVTISLSDDTRIRDAMSATAKITTESKTSALLVPSEAIIAEGSDRYVEIVENGDVTKVQVTTGLANETSTEILSGLSEGDTVVLQDSQRDAFSDYMTYMQQNSPMARMANGSSAGSSSASAVSAGNGSGSGQSSSGSAAGASGAGA